MQTIPSDAINRLNKYELQFYCRLVDMGERPEYEFKFHPTRKWRFDLAIPHHRIAIEIEGGTWSGGRHSRGAGFRGDCEKYNEAQKLGYVVLRYTPDMIDSVQKDVMAIIELKRIGKTSQP